MVDLGSGAGLPGLVAAILAPGPSYRLVDARGTKTRFLRQAVIELGLDGVAVDRRRIEALPSAPAPRMLTARALAPPPRLLELCGPLMGARSELVAWTGPVGAEALEDLPSPFELEGAHAYRLPDRRVEHRLVVVRRRD